MMLRPLRLLRQPKVTPSSQEVGERDLDGRPLRLLRRLGISRPLKPTLYDHR